MLRIILNLFISGLIFASGPCLVSCGPILFSYIGGTKRNIFKGLLVYLIFSFSRILAYILLSLIIFSVGSFITERVLGNFSKYLFIIGGLFIILIGALTCIGQRLEFKFWYSLFENIIEKDKKSILLLGLIIGLLPCAPLLAILSYIGLVSKNLYQSPLYALSFGLGTLLSPLILVSIFAGFIPGLLLHRKPIYHQVFSFICGLIIIFLGFQLVIRAF